MFVTPNELRDADIPSATRGFNKDAVDDMLERAADTIEGLQRDLAAAKAERPRNDSRQTPAVSATPRSAADGQPSEELIQRTLLLAQKAADEAVAEARSIARRLIEDANAEATKRRADAEREAAAAFETTRSELQGAVDELTRHRDVLVSDVAALEAFRDDFDQRLRTAVSSELDRLEQRSSLVSVPAAPPLESLSTPRLSDADTREHRYSDYAADAPAESDVSTAAVAERHESEAALEAPIVDLVDLPEGEYEDDFTASLREAIEEEPAGAADLFSTANRAEYRDLF